MAHKTEQPIDATKAEKIAEFSSKALLVASDDVIREWQEVQRYNRDHPNAGTQGLPYFGRLWLALRRDMGNPRTNLSVQEALQTYISVEDWDEISKLVM